MYAFRITIGHVHILITGYCSGYCTSLRYIFWRMQTTNRTSCLRETFQLLLSADHIIYVFSGHLHDVVDAFDL